MSAQLARSLRRKSVTPSSKRDEALRDPKRNPDGYRKDEAVETENAFYEQRNRSLPVTSAVPDPTALLIIYEADRLKEVGLEQVRSIFEHGGIGLVPVVMQGIEKRLARYPQFYSRIGFVHEFRTLAASEIRQLLERAGCRPAYSTAAAFGLRNDRDDHPHDGWQLSIVKSPSNTDRAGSRNQRTSRGDEGGCGSGSGKSGDRRGLRSRRRASARKIALPLRDYIGAYPLISANRSVRCHIGQRVRLAVTFLISTRCLSTLHPAGDCLF